MLTNKILFLTCLLFTSQLIPPTAAKEFTAYFQSWSEKWASKGSDLTLANLPSYVNTIILSFLKPDNSYAAGSMSLADSGLDFSSDGSVVKEAIGIAKGKGQKVLVAIGGANYANWAGLNEAGIAAFVTDFGLDGVDIDFEPGDAGCTQSGGTVTCAIDQQFQDITNRIRQAVPQPALLSMAGWSIGAYGEGDFQSAQPQGANTGLCVNLLKSDAGKSLDQVNIMSYDAGPDFDPKKAFQAYRSLFGGKLMLGVEIPPEAWGGHVLSIGELDGLCDFVNQNGGDGDGMMLWSLNKKPDGSVSESNPDATMVSQEICRKLGLNDCDTPLPAAVKETTDIYELIAALNREKDAWISHYMQTMALDKTISNGLKRSSKELEEIIASLPGALIEVAATLNRLTNTFDSEVIDELIASLKPKRGAWISPEKYRAGAKVGLPLFFEFDKATGQYLTSLKDSDDASAEGVAEDVGGKDFLGRRSIRNAVNVVGP